MVAAGGPEAPQRRPLCGKAPPYPWSPDHLLPAFTTSPPEFPSNLPPMIKHLPENEWEAYARAYQQPGDYPAVECNTQEAYALPRSFPRSQEERDQEFREWENGGKCYWKSVGGST